MSDLLQLQAVTFVMVCSTSMASFSRCRQNSVKINLTHAAMVLVLDTHTGIFLFPKKAMAVGIICLTKILT